MSEAATPDLWLAVKCAAAAVGSGLVSGFGGHRISSNSLRARVTKIEYQLKQDRERVTFGIRDLRAELTRDRLTQTAMHEQNRRQMDSITDEVRAIRGALDHTTENLTRMVTDIWKVIASDK